MMSDDHDPYTDGITDKRCLALRAESGRVNDARPIISFFYELMRDHLPTGTVEELVRRNEMVSLDNVGQFTNGYLVRYAQHLADRLAIEPSDGHQVVRVSLADSWEKPAEVGARLGDEIAERLAEEYHWAGASEAINFYDALIERLERSRDAAHHAMDL